MSCFLRVVSVVYLFKSKKWSPWRYCARCVARGSEMTFPYTWGQVCSWEHGGGVTGTLEDREQWTKGQSEIIGTVLRFYRWRSFSRKTVKQCWQTKIKKQIVDKTRIWKMLEKINWMSVVFLCFWFLDKFADKCKTVYWNWTCVVLKRTIGPMSFWLIEWHMKRIKVTWIYSFIDYYHDVLFGEQWRGTWRGHPLDNWMITGWLTLFIGTLF